MSMHVPAMSDAEWAATLEADVEIDGDDPSFLDTGVTFPRAQDTGLSGHTHKSYGFLAEYGLEGGVAPGPLTFTTGASVLAWSEAVGYVGDSPWLGFIPRVGEQPCDTVRHMWCDTCKMKIPVPLKCESLTCPRCHNIWAHERAGEATARIHYGFRIGKVQGRPYHMMIRPPTGTIEPSPDALVAFRKRAEAIAKEHGMQGGCVVIHAGTHKPGDKTPLYQPHAHITGIVRGHYVPGPSREGWTVKFKKIHGPDVFKNVKTLLIYELRHAVRFHAKTHHALVWFGCLAYHAFPGPSEEWLDENGYHGKDYRVCPICGSRLVPLDEGSFMNYPGTVFDAPVYSRPARPQLYTHY